MAFLVLGRSVLKQIAEALGLGGQHIGRIVLDIPVRGVFKVYVEALPGVDEAALVKALAEAKATGEVEVVPCCHVVVTPPGDARCEITAKR